MHAAASCRTGGFRLVLGVAIFIAVGWALFGGKQNILNFSSSSLSSAAFGGSIQKSLYSRLYHRARNESFGFFDDVPEYEWDLIKARVRQVQPNTCPYCRGGNNPHAWFQNHYEPEFACRHERRVGRLGDGGKWVCDPHRLKANEDCLVYSVGSNNDFSFETAILETIGPHCEIHTFDPGDYSAGAAMVGPPGKVHYHQWGIDGSASAGGRGVFKTLRQTVEDLGHQNRTVSIFKIDCEGCELTSYNTWINDTEIHGVSLQQILVEVHGQSVGEGQFQIQQPETSDFFKVLHQHGYVIFHKEPNIHYWRYRPCVEFGLLKLSRSFFDE